MPWFRFGTIYIIRVGVLVLGKLQTTLQPLLKLTYFHVVCTLYNKTNGPKLQNAPHMYFITYARNFMIRFSGNEFSQDCSGHYSVKCHVWEKVYLLSYGSKSHWPIILHDFSECSFSLTTWLVRVIMIDAFSVLEVCRCTGNRKGDFFIGNSASNTCSTWYHHWWLDFIDLRTAKTAQNFDCWWF